MNLSLSKECYRCNRVLAIHNFYRHPEMKDGHLNKCKDCCRRESVIVSRGEKARKRDIDRYHNNPDRRSMIREHAKNSRKQNRKRANARNKVARAIANGELLKHPCEVCGKLEVEAHHEDYADPLNVVWLCRIHHGERHRTVDIE